MSNSSQFALHHFTVFVQQLAICPASLHCLCPTARNLPCITSLFVSNSSQFALHHFTVCVQQLAICPASLHSFYIQHKSTPEIRIYTIAFINIAHFLSTNKIIFLQTKTDSEVLFLQYFQYKVTVRLAVSQHFRQRGPPGGQDQILVCQFWGTLRRVGGVCNNQSPLPVGCTYLHTYMHNTHTHNTIIPRPLLNIHTSYLTSSL